jgi:YgiT-type zinc finger domain-containing protein
VKLTRRTRCSVCRHVGLVAGNVTRTVARGSTIVVFKLVPARVCANCGEERVDKRTTSRLWASAARASKAGVQFQIRTYRRLPR